MSIVLTFFLEHSARYGIASVCFIACVGFGKVIMGFISTIKTGKNINLIVHYIKLLNLADGFIAIALVQRAILMMEGIENANFYSSLGGIVFSALSFAVSIFIIIELSVIKKRKNEHNLQE